MQRRRQGKIISSHEVDDKLEVRKTGGGILPPFSK